MEYFRVSGDYFCIFDNRPVKITEEGLVDPNWPVEGERKVSSYKCSRGCLSTNCLVNRGTEKHWVSRFQRSVASF